MGGGLGGGLGGINPLMLSLLSCKEPVADCQKPNEGTTLCGKGSLIHFYKRLDLLRYLP